MKPNDYKDQVGCHNCYHAFFKDEWEEARSYFCTLGDDPTKERPLCGSVMMDESFFTHKKDDANAHRRKKKTFEQLYKEWEVWSAHREVEAWGICVNWKMGQEEKEVI